MLNLFFVFYKDKLGKKKPKIRLVALSYCYFKQKGGLNLKYPSQNILILYS
jgi:hypothetical protein